VIQTSSNWVEQVPRPTDKDTHPAHLEVRQAQWDRAKAINDRTSKRSAEIIAEREAKTEDARKQREVDAAKKREAQRTEAEAVLRRRFLAAGGTESDEKYSTLLIDALSRTVAYRPLEVIAHEVGMRGDTESTFEMAQNLVREVTTELDAYQDSVATLYAIRPEQRELLEVRMRAIGYLRAEQEIHGCKATVLVAIGKGDSQTAKKFQRKLLRFEDVQPTIHDDFAKELKRLKNNQPARYAALHLPPDLLLKLTLAALID
jgi:hypothetical protein